MLTSFAIPVAFIHGDRLADLSVEFELEKAPGVAELLSVIVNREDVEAIMNKPVSSLGISFSINFFFYLFIFHCSLNVNEDIYLIRL